MLKLIRNLLSPRKGKPGRGEAASGTLVETSSRRPAKPDWERALTAPIEQNCMAPSDDAILHAFDLHCQERYTPTLQRQHEMEDLRADISADIADIWALAPILFERAISRHPFEFSHALEHKEND